MDCSIRRVITVRERTVIKRNHDTQCGCRGGTPEPGQDPLSGFSFLRLQRRTRRVQTLPPNPLENACNNRRRDQGRQAPFGAVITSNHVGGSVS
jgi:hypothetical protein